MIPSYLILILGLGAAIIVGLVWACCAMAGAADDASDEFARNLTDRSRMGREIINHATADSAAEGQ